MCVYIYTYMSSICLPNITCQVTDSGPVVASFRYTAAAVAARNCLHGALLEAANPLRNPWDCDHPMEYHEDVPCL